MNFCELRHSNVGSNSDGARVVRASIFPVNIILKMDIGGDLLLGAEKKNVR